MPKYKPRAAAAELWPKSISRWPAAWFLSSVDNVTSTSHQSPSPIYSSQRCNLYWPKSSTTPWGPLPRLGNYGGNSSELKENEELTVHWTFNYNRQNLDSERESFSSALFLVKENTSVNEGEDGLCPEGLLARPLLQFIRVSGITECNWESVAELLGECVRSLFCLCQQTAQKTSSCTLLKHLSLSLRWRCLMAFPLLS